MYSNSILLYVEPGWIRPMQIFNHLNMEYGQFEKHIFSIYDVGNSKLIPFLL